MQFPRAGLDVLVASFRVFALREDAFRRALIELDPGELEALQDFLR